MNLHKKVAKLFRNRQLDPYQRQDRIDELVSSYKNDERLFELLTLLEEEQISSKIFSDENVVDLGERRAYNKIKMRIFNLT